MNIKQIEKSVSYLGLKEHQLLNIIQNNKFSLKDSISINKDIYIDIFKELRVNDCSIGELEDLLLKRVKEKMGEFRELKPIDKVSFLDGKINYHGAVCSNSKEDIVIEWITQKMRKEKLMFTYGSYNKLLHIIIGNTLLTYDISKLNINKTIRKLRRKAEYQTPFKAIQYLERNIKRAEFL